MKERTYEVEIYNENGQSMMFISADGASGCSYEVDTPEEIGVYVADYIASFDEEGK